MGLASPSALSNPSQITTVSTGSILELRVIINSTDLHAGQSLNITVSLFNAQSTTYNISIPSTGPFLQYGFKVSAFPISMWGPCMFPEPVEFVIVKGNYSLGEMEQLARNTSTPSVVCMEGGSMSSIAFQPNSDVANLSGSFCTVGCYNYHETTRLVSNFTVKGYWGYPLNSSEAQDLFTPVGGCLPGHGGCGIGFQYPEVGPIAQAPFSPGEYTLVVSDAWGQVELLQFAVT